MTVIDVNNDAKTWQANKSGWVNYSYHRTNGGDDWLITPALKLEAGKAYDLTTIIGSYNSYNEEKFEIYVGTAPTAEAMTIQIVAPTATKTCYKDNPEVKGVVNVPATGLYYIGIHCISDPNKMSLYCKSIKLEMGYSPSAPGDLQDVAIEANPYGDYMVKVAFTVPTVNYVGDALTENVTVKLLRDNQEAKTWDLAPGTKVEYTDTLQHMGLYNYRLTPYNAAGMEGRSVVVDKLFVGPNAASVPQNVTVTEADEPGTVTVKWDAVTTDVKGTVLDPKDVAYNLYSPSINGLSTSFRDPFAECEKTIKELKDPSKQKFVRYCVAAFNRGMKGDVSALTPPFPIGVSY
ncbi:MAG: hypothetical protein K2M76_02405, partial [Muribaculaceae bacterium]|nr:hypothetical protein [Muribaculaceae bacterium]